jgi:hypothetical protein
MFFRFSICNGLCSLDFQFVMVMFFRFSNLSRDWEGIEEFQNGSVYVSIETVAALTRLLP